MQYLFSTVTHREQAAFSQRSDAFLLRIAGSADNALSWVEERLPLGASHFSSSLNQAAIGGGNMLHATARDWTDGVTPGLTVVKWGHSAMQLEQGKGTDIVEPPPYSDRILRRTSRSLDRYYQTARLHFTTQGAPIGASPFLSGTSVPASPRIDLDREISGTAMITANGMNAISDGLSIMGGSKTFMADVYGKGYYGVNIALDFADGKPGSEMLYNFTKSYFSNTVGLAVGGAVATSIAVILGSPITAPIAGLGLVAGAITGEFANVSFDQASEAAHSAIEEASSYALNVGRAIEESVRSLYMP